MQYKFKKPFKYGNENIETVELKEEFNAGDMIRIANAKGDGDKTGAMLVAATGWPLPKVACIPIADALAIAGVVTTFFGLSETDGPEM
ncbi:phage tail assembly protein [Fibrobacter sp.]|uniref:phage tail assembly protein n=1 Tax=Fibrobacter sp. TaxID=35828 RepID=UPI00388D004A